MRAIQGNDADVPLAREWPQRGRSVTHDRRGLRHERDLRRVAGGVATEPVVGIHERHGVRCLGDGTYRFVVAVVAPLLLMPVLIEPGGWNVSGTAWSISSGAAGALGALGIIMAFNFGGKPIYVMPLVFRLNFLR